MTEEHEIPRPLEGPPPVYVRPGQTTPDRGAGESAAREVPMAPKRPEAKTAEPATPSVPEPETPVVAGPEAPAVIRIDPGSRTARNRTRRSRRRGLLRLGVVAVVLVGIIIAVVLVTTGRAVVPVVSEQIYPIRYQDDIARVAEQYDLDPYLVAAVAQTESGFDPEAVSPVGAVGLMQLMPATAAWITGLDTWEGDADPDLTDPIASLELGACYLHYLSGRFDGNSRLTLAAYNAGQGSVSDWIEAAGGADSFELTDIRFPETQEFVRRVEHYWDLYKRVYPDMFSERGPGMNDGSRMLSRWERWS